MAALLALSASTASAQVLTWGTSGTGGGGTWNAGTTTNWWNGTNVVWPNSGTANGAVFAGTAGTVTIAAGGVSANSLLFSTTGYTLSGAGTITLNGATPTITLGSGISGTIGNNTATVLAGTAGLTKAGAGTLTLNGSVVNTFTGGLTVSGGTLSLDYSNYNGNQLIDSGNSLTLGGGALALQGNATASAANVQTFASTTLNAGYNTIAIAKGSGGTSVTLNLGQVTMNPGAVVVVVPTTAWTITSQTSTTEIVNVTSGGSIALPGSGTTAFANAGIMVNVGTQTRWVQVNSSGQLICAPTASTWVNSGAVVTNVYNVGTTTQTLTASQSMYGMISNATSPVPTIILGSSTTGYTLTANGIININSGLLTIQPGITSGTLQIGAEKTFVINAAQSGGVTISAPIANNGANASNVTVNSTGGGVTTLSGANTYTGTTFLNAGSLTLGAANTLNSASGLVVSGGTLGFTTFNQSVNSVRLAGGAITATTGTLTSATDFDVRDGSISGILAGSVGLTKTTSGTVALSGSNVFSGNTTISAGVLRVGNATALGAGTGAVSVTSGGALDLNGTTMTGTNRLTLNGTGISSGGALTNSSTTAATYAGLVSLGSAGSIVAASGNITLSNSGTITGSGFGLTVGGSSNTSIASVIGTGAGTLTKVGSGTLTLSGANTFSGATTISAGKLSVASNVIASSTTIFIGDGATLESSGGFTLSANQAVTGTGTTGFVNTIATNGLGLVGNNTISTSGTLTLTRLQVLGTTSNQITGGTIVSGSAGVSRGLVVGSSGTGTLTITNATLLTRGGTASNSCDVVGNVASSIGTLNVNSGGSYATEGAGKLSLGLTNSASGILNINSGGSATIGEIDFVPGASGTAAVNLNTSGTLTLSKISSGTSGTRTLNFDGGQFIAGASFDSGTAVRLNVKNGGARIDTAGNAFTISGTLVNDGSGGLTKSGAGTLTLAAANTFTGETLVSAGTLALSGSGAIGSSSGVNISGSGARLDISGASGNRTVSSLEGVIGSSVLLGGNTLTANNATNKTFAGVISGSGGFTKAGGGILTFSDIQTFTGAARVDAGTLAIGGTNTLAAASQIFVAAGATLDATAAGLNIRNGQLLGGYGLLDGNATSLSFASGATLSPGGSVGSLDGDFTNATLTGGMTYVFEVNMANGTAGGPNGWDLFTNTGAITLDASGANQILLNILSLDGAVSGTASNFDPTYNYAWKFLVAGSGNPITYQSNWFNVSATNFQNSHPGTFYVARGDSLSSIGAPAGGTNELYVVYAAVPEPGTLALACLGLAALGWRLHRRQR